jgi:phage shock protein A
MVKTLRKIWRYVASWFGVKFEEKADPKVQLQMAIDEAKEQSRKLRETAILVMANKTQSEARLNAKIAALAKATTETRQAVLMADEATKAGDTTRATSFTATATALANHIISLEAEVEGLRSLVLSATRDAESAHAAVDQNSAMLQKKLSEQRELLGKLDQAVMQEQMSKAMGTLSQSVGVEGPSFDEVRDKIDARVAKASARNELDGSSVEARMLEVQAQTQNFTAQARLEEIKSQLGIEPAKIEPVVDILQPQTQGA